MATRNQQAADIRGQARGFFLFFVVMLFAPACFFGCAGKDFSAIRAGIETRGHYIERVPFYRQTESTCGPAALASVLAFWGHPANLEQITAKIYLPELRGTLPMDMENFAKEAGFTTLSSAGTLAELKALVRKGMPVICMLDLGFGPYRRPHYVTVTGFDDGNTVIIAHDGLQPNSLVGYATFNKTWTRAGRWMLVITPKSVEGKHEP